MVHRSPGGTARIARMPSTSGESRRAALALLGVVAACGAWLLAAALRNPEVPFLAARAGASWITYPSPPTALPQPAAPLDAVFHRSFTLEHRPAAAVLRALWYRQGAVWLNGTQVAASEPESWKVPVAADVAHLLHPGENRLDARVVNGSGPPALWLALAGDGLDVATDASWEVVLAGASARPARLATIPMSAWGSPTSLRSPVVSNPLAAARTNLPLLLLFAAASLGALALLRRWERKQGEGPARLTRRGALLLFALVAVAWGLLFWRVRLLAPVWGFDTQSHQEYVRYLLDRGRLPLADEGWEMYQPPLYYLLAAGLLKLTGHTTLDAAATPVWRFLGWLIGLLQCGALLAGLRVVFEDRVRPVLAGLFLAFCLPMQLYIFQYVSNEGLHAALSTLALVLALGILRREDTSARAHLVLGAVLGLAMLAKFSALLTIGVVGGVLAGRLAVRKVRAPWVWARSLGSLALGLIAVCGWHYARVTAHFGKPLIGNWDAGLGFSWWMDPGYATSGHFLRFGHSLTEPLFSAYHSLPDAIYSTLWGDGLLGGASLSALRPPWNQGLMIAGYLLALLPSLAILAGLIGALVRLVRQPRAEWFLLLGALGGTLFGVLAMALKLPFYAQAKAFYGLSAVLALGALGALGCEMLARRRLAGLLVYTLLGTWGLCAYFTFWVVQGATGEPTAATYAVLDPEGLLGRSSAAAAQGRTEEAIALARRATVLAPDHPTAWGQLGVLLARTGRLEEAVTALREALRVTPRDRDLHAQLAALYEKAGASAPARYHRRYAETLPKWGQ